MNLTFLRLSKKKKALRERGLLHNREFNPYHEVAMAIMSEVSYKFKQN